MKFNVVQDSLYVEVGEKFNSYESFLDFKKNIKDRLGDEIKSIVFVFSTNYLNECVIGYLLSLSSEFEVKIHTKNSLLFEYLSKLFLTKKFDIKMG